MSSIGTLLEENANPVPAGISSQSETCTCFRRTWFLLNDDGHEQSIIAFRETRVCSSSATPVLDSSRIKGGTGLAKVW